MCIYLVYRVINLYPGFIHFWSFLSRCWCNILSKEFPAPALREQRYSGRCAFLVTSDTRIKQNTTLCFYRKTWRLFSNCCDASGIKLVGHAAIRKFKFNFAYLLCCCCFVFLVLGGLVRGIRTITGEYMDWTRSASDRRIWNKPYRRWKNLSPVEPQEEGDNKLWCESLQCWVTPTKDFQVPVSTV